jgi:hypothetical protein
MLFFRMKFLWGSRLQKYQALHLHDAKFQPTNLMSLFQRFTTILHRSHMLSQAHDILFPFPIPEQYYPHLHFPD